MIFTVKSQQVKLVSTFTRNNLAWGFFIELSFHFAPEIAGHCDGWGVNDGEGLNACQAIKLAEVLQTAFESGTIASYLAESFQEERCEVCGGRDGKFTFETGPVTHPHLTTTDPALLRKTGEAQFSVAMMLDDTEAKKTLGQNRSGQGEFAFPPAKPVKAQDSGQLDDKTGLIRFTARAYAKYGKPHALLMRWSGYKGWELLPCQEWSRKCPVDLGHTALVPFRLISDTVGVFDW